MAQIIPGTAGFGQSFGQGLSNGLTALAEHKLSQVLERQVQSRDEKVFEDAGFTPQASRFLSKQPANLRHAYIKSGAAGFVSPSSEEVQQKNTQSLQANAITPQEQESVALHDLFQSLNPRSQSNPAQRQLEQLSGSQGKNFLQGLLAQNPQLNSQLSQQVAAPQAEAADLEPQRKQPIAQTNGNVSVAEALYPSKLSKSQLSDQKSINSEARKSDEKYQEKGQVSRSAIEALDKMEQLALSGKMTKRGILTAIRGLSKKITGQPYEAAFSPETGEFIGLKANLYPLADYFIKGNLTNQKFAAFDNKIPNESDSKETQLAKIKNLRKEVLKFVDEQDASTALTKKYGEDAPKDYTAQVLKEARRLTHERTKGADDIVKNEIKSLPSPSSAQEDQDYTNPETGHVFNVINGKWVRVA